MFRAIAVCLLLGVAPLSAQNKDLVALQRYISDLSEEVRNLQKSVNESIASLTQRQADQLRAANADSAKTMTDLGDRIAKELQNQRDAQQQSVTSLAAISTRLQSVSSDVGDLKEAVTALTSAVTKLSTQLTDVENAVKIMSLPPAKPPEPTAPTMSATDLLTNADRDYQGGNLDIALQGYQQVLKWYPDSPDAPRAVYRIGLVQYSTKQYDDAVKTFDQLIQTYPKSDRAPEALFYKGKSLADSGHPAEAQSAYAELRRRFPKSPLVQQIK